LADTKMIYNDATIIYNRPELTTGGGRRRFQAAFLLRRGPPPTISTWWGAGRRRRSACRSFRIERRWPSRA